MLSTSKQIQKQKKYRDHGNATMSKAQRDFVKAEIIKRYISGEIKETKILKSKIIELGNKYYSETNKGKPITELRKSTFYDFLRENDIPLPKKFKNSNENESKKINVKVEEASEVTSSASTEVSEAPEKPKMVSIETQTDDENLFQYLLLYNQLVLVPLKQIKNGISYKFPASN